ncbi:hypothetical protein OU798_08025 [Prolixibacteraceae bacterium Z1-6]|uniref:DUF4402 domain-containing protein n=1 Tax=Draconibacterium aestuarii TaxID=2998507 RepID=A0A9X3F5N7_9BACT|nr:hypothetical protein [Prolixibacteraceae bacterium Z1-6]
MKLKATILTLLFISFVSFSVYAQNSAVSHKINVDVPEVALLGLVAESSKEITVSAVAPNEAGSAVDFSLKNKDHIWINYSSILSKSTQKRKVIATVQGEIPAGVTLNVQASEYSGAGKGKLGKSAGVVTLSNQPTDVIVDIGSCFTGKGVNNGHYLTYQLQQKTSSVDYAQLSQSQIAVNVVYTLTDYN